MSRYDPDGRFRSVLPFEAQAPSVRELRRLVREQLARWGLPNAAEEADLAVSELVTNVIKHVGEGAPATLVMETAGDRLRIELHDRSYVVPVSMVAASEDESGRGLHLLASVVVDWGTVVTATGKSVWCELPADPEAPCRRIQRAEAVLGTYRRGVGERLPLLESHAGQIFEESVTDLIADLLHWVAARGGDPDGLLDRAQMHYEAEAA